jgi:hypothetical protein
MNKTIQMLALVVALTTTTLLVAFKAPQGEVCIKVKNDTGASVTLHTGKGTAPMNSGVEKDFCMEEGSKLYFANKGQKGKLIVEFKADMNKKKIKLSDYQ